MIVWKEPLPPLRVFLVDDHSEFLGALAQFLSGDPRIEIVGQASSGTVALQRVAQIMPDLVLLDLSMPDLNGLEVTRRLKHWPNAPRVIILTIYDLPQYRRAAQAAGADGFVSKAGFSAQLRLLISTLFPEIDSNGNEATRSS
jgi:DNA-binding NarL/FixJ family response regulator